MQPSGNLHSARAAAIADDAAAFTSAQSLALGRPLQTPMMREMSSRMGMGDLAGGRGQRGAFTEGVGDSHAVPLPQVEPKL